LLFLKNFITVTPVNFVDNFFLGLDVIVAHLILIYSNQWNKTTNFLSFLALISAYDVNFTSDISYN